MRYTFKRDERLRSPKTISEIYKQGVSGYLYPFRYSYLASLNSEGFPPARIMIAISKRRIRRAVDRNLIRRRIREAFRINKALLSQPLQDSGVRVDLIITCIAGQIESWQEIERKIVLLLQDIAKKALHNIE